LLEDARGRMAKSAESAQHEFSTVRTGRDSPALRERVVVDYYGAMTPLNQLATISAPEARLITVQPYDKSSIKGIEKAINESDIGLNPSNDGNLVRLVVPELTEERRHELVKVVRQLAEDGRVAIRNVRRDTMHQLRELKTEGEASSDDEHRAEVELQKVTDARVSDLDTCSRRRKRRSSKSDGRPRRTAGGRRREPRRGPQLPGRARRALCSDHHRRQRPLGASARSARHRGAQRRCRHRQGPPA